MPNLVKPIDSGEEVENVKKKNVYGQRAITKAYLNFQLK
jgi:hypothetical protein